MIVPKTTETRCMYMYAGMAGSMLARWVTTQEPCSYTFFLIVLTLLPVISLHSLKENVMHVQEKM